MRSQRPERGLVRSLRFHPGSACGSIPAPPATGGASKCRSQSHCLGRLLLPGKHPQKGAQLISGTGRSPGTGPPPFSGAKIKGAWILLAPVRATCNKCLESLLLPQLGQGALGAPHLGAQLHCGITPAPFHKKTIGNCTKRLLIQAGPRGTANMESLTIC